jgi:hypothetical protein
VRSGRHLTVPEQQRQSWKSQEIQFVEIIRKLIFQLIFSVFVQHFIVRADLQLIAVLSGI